MPHRRQRLRLSIREEIGQASSCLPLSLLVLKTTRFRVKTGTPTDARSSWALSSAVDTGLVILAALKRSDAWLVDLPEASVEV